MGVGFWPEHSWGTLNKKDAKLVAVDEPTFTREIILAKTSRTSNKAILDEFEACLVKNLQGHGAINSHHAPQLPPTTKTITEIVDLK